MTKISPSSLRILLWIIVGIWFGLLYYILMSRNKRKMYQEGYASQSLLTQDRGMKTIVQEPPSTTTTPSFSSPPAILTNDKELGEFASGTLDHSAIPNFIWMFWDGDVSSNRVVSLCIDSWKHYNPTYDVIVLNKTNYRTYVDTDIASLRHAGDDITRFADFLRCLVLSKHGGIWVDASIICHAPVGWVHGIQTAHQVELVGYYNGSTDVATMLHTSPTIENWFFACVPNSKFMTDWCTEFLRFNDFDTVEQYLADLRGQNVKFVNMMYLEYLTMHASSQLVFQHHPDTYRIYLFCCNHGPFQYLDDVGWKGVDGVNLLVQPDTSAHYHQYTMTKLCKNERTELMKRDDADILRAFSHLPTPPPMKPKAEAFTERK
jgi:hypothetical protein